MSICWPPTLNCVVCTNESTVFNSSLVAAPSSVNPLGLYFCCMEIRMGISPRQGSHHVPQKLTSTTLPFRLDSFTSFPCKSLNVTSGSSASVAGLLAPPPEGAPLLQPEKPAATTTIATASRNVLSAL